MKKLNWIQILSLAALLATAHNAQADSPCEISGNVKNVEFNDARRAAWPGSPQEDGALLLNTDEFQVRAYKSVSRTISILVKSSGVLYTTIGYLDEGISASVQLKEAGISISCSALTSI